MSNSWFQFKKFRIEQQRSALKVGTDGVLLGAWCSVEEKIKTEVGSRRMETGEPGDWETSGLGDLETGRLGDWKLKTEDCRLKTEDRRREVSSKTLRILDVGTGTGLIALMLAQRTDAEIDAVEINDKACNDALHNFQESPWTDRLKLYKADFNHFIETHSIRYDRIVCNPPFFERSLRSADSDTSMARHDVLLTFPQLIAGSRKLLNDSGLLAVIIPVSAFDNFRETARLSGFYLLRKTTVIPRTGKAPKRVLLEFSVGQVYPVNDELVILQENNKYSEQFVTLTKDFYLNFL